MLAVTENINIADRRRQKRAIRNRGADRAKAGAGQHRARDHGRRNLKAKTNAHHRYADGTGRSPGSTGSQTDDGAEREGNAEENLRSDDLQSPQHKRRNGAARKKHGDHAADGKKQSEQAHTDFYHLGYGLFDLLHGVAETEGERPQHEPGEQQGDHNGNF